MTNSPATLNFHSKSPFLCLFMDFWKIDIIRICLHCLHLFPKIFPNKKWKSSVIQNGGNVFFLTKFYAVYSGIQSQTKPTFHSQ